jgi:hypothetical protein
MLKNLLRVKEDKNSLKIIIHKKIKKMLKKIKTMMNRVNR